MEKSKPTWKPETAAQKFRRKLRDSSRHDAERDKIKKRNQAYRDKNRCHYLEQRRAQNKRAKLRKVIADIPITAHHVSDKQKEADELAGCSKFHFNLNSIFTRHYNEYFSNQRNEPGMCICVYFFHSVIKHP